MRNSDLVTPDRWESSAARPRPVLRSAGPAAVCPRASGWTSNRPMRPLAMRFTSVRCRAARRGDCRAGVQVVLVDSAATDRRTYLQRPDLGRRLDERSRYTSCKNCKTGSELDLAIIVSDGLVGDSRPSTGRAVSRVAVAKAPEPMLGDRADSRCSLRPRGTRRRDRATLGARLALMLIGERPGLGSPDSWGRISSMRRGPETPMRTAIACRISGRRACRTKRRPERFTIC